ncbi:MAG: M48 family metalloprotease [Frankiales bacterium]|nr:M48 family metalloprotease [Frankiales bacterium]
MLALLLAGAFGLTIPRWSDHLPPQVAARVLLGCSALVAAATAVILVMVALPVAGRSDVLADGRWSDVVFKQHSTVEVSIGAVSLLCLCASVASTVREVRRQRRSVAAVRAFRRRLGPAAGGLIVLPTDERDALAIDGDTILLTRGLIRSLNAEQRRAVLAHERAHLSHHHDRYTRAASVLAAANPLLFRLPVAVSYLVERWADEEAAQASSRTAVAEALELAARKPGRARFPHHQSVALAAALVAVERRIAVLRMPLSPVRPAFMLPPVVISAAAVIIALVLTERTMDLFQLAMIVRRATGR